MIITRYIALIPVFATLLSGCASESPHQPKAQATISEHQSQNNRQCSDQAQPPLINCAATVTATFDAKGQLWIAWVNQDHIYVQSSADKGQHFSQPVAVNTVAEVVTAHDEYRPKIKLDDKGNIYLTWTQNLGSMRSGNIRFSRSTDGGKSFSAPVTVNDNQDAIGHRFDALAVGNNGEIFVAWLDARDKDRAKAAGQEFSGSSLYYAWSEDGGKSFYPNKLLAQHSCECCRLDVVIDKQNLPVILWRQVFDGGIRDHALVKFTDWNTPGVMRRVGKENWKIDACPHHGPALSLADNGIYHAAWFSGAVDKQGLFYAHSADQGQTFSAPYQFGKSGKHPHVLAAAGQVAIVWMEFDGSQNTIQMIKSQDGGQRWSHPKQLGSVGGNADYGFLVSDGQAIYLSWKNGDSYQFKAIDN
ncbi:MAG: sialidase family protein [Methylomonas sp.]